MNFELTPEWIFFGLFGIAVAAYGFYLLYKEKQKEASDKHDK